MSLKDERKIHPPEQFSFPFEPYSIQNDFMKSLFQVIEDGKIGIFESPTGTGKSMSMICGALTWLCNHNQRSNEAVETSLSKNSQNSAICTEVDENEPLWVREFAQRQLLDNETRQARVLKTLQEKNEQQRTIARKSILTDCINIDQTPKHKRKVRQDETILLMEQAKKELEKHDRGQIMSDDGDDDEAFTLDAYQSDDEAVAEENKQILDTEEEEVVPTKIFFCSRTHSQLSQFIHELQKSPFAESAADDGNEKFVVSSAALASRKTLCVNDNVRKLTSVHQINERCLEMQKNKSKVAPSDGEPKRKKKAQNSCTCEFLRNNDGMSHLTNKIVGSIMDIEELLKEGEKIKACPYYAARRALPLSQLVVLPYQTLLHESTRQASGIDLRNSVVIIDEAHNLVEALNSMHSCQVTPSQLRKALNQLSQYADKFNKRLKAKNLFYVKQLLYVMRSLLSVFTDGSQLKPSKGNKTSPESQLLTLSTFLFKSSLDNINFFKLLRYCSRSKISFKLSGFFEKYELDVQPSKPRSALQRFLRDAKSQEAQHLAIGPASPDVTIKSPLMHIESFLRSLTSSSEDCRIAVTSGKDASLKFLLLSPAEHFKPLLDQCRSVIVAGGTMQPSSCLVNQLLPRQQAEQYRSRIVEFTCDHVIDGRTQLLPIALGCGPSNENFEFTFEKRNQLGLISQLGMLIMNVINVIPGGVICFFPSYDYESLVFERWLNMGVIAKLENKKKVFREPKKSDQVEQVLTEYTRCIERTKASTGKVNGALLLSVVNGKMSEGINFSDDLGRCVIMVGLPYPNLHSPELKEKMAYLNQNLPRHSDGRTAGQVHYENLCMKAVNQSIGRAIRHRNDYACLLLVDIRYGRPSVAGKLPNWIGKHLRTFARFGEAFAAIRKFFNDKSKQEGES